MRKELEKLISDIKKVKEAESILSSVDTIKFDSEINKLVKYAITHNIIKGSIDIVDIRLEIPEVKTVVCSLYDNNIQEKIKNVDDKRKIAEEKYNNRYAGTYNSLSEVAGYGTEWNERCIPDGVIIRGLNSRC